MEQIDPVAVLSGALAERWDRFMHEASRCRRRPGESAIHDLRVATRRLLAAMTTVNVILPGRPFRRPSAELRRHLKAFNAIRDVHVQRRAVRALKPRFPVLRQYEIQLRRQELVFGRAVRLAIRSIRRDSLIRSLAEVQAALSVLYGTPASSRALGAMLLGSVAGAYGKVLARRAALTALDPRSVHRMRVAFKKFRYTLELARPLLPWADGKHRRAMDAFQTMMGEIQDREVLIDGIRKFARRSARSGTPLFLPVLQLLVSDRAVKLSGFLRASDALEEFWR